jgi:hypothetical protein
MATLWLPTELFGAATKTDLFLTVLILAAALLLGAAILKWVDRRRKQADDHVLSAQEQLAHFQQLHWRGELSKEEFERIQSKLAERVRQEQAPANPAVPPNHPDNPGTPQPPETGIRPEPPG